jgi:MFS family permease
MRHADRISIARAEYLKFSFWARNPLSSSGRRRVAGEQSMTDRERQGWIIVGAIFVTMFFIWGGINSGAVFFVPVVKYFGWSRAKLSVALSIGWVTGGAAGPFIGWLADRIDPKRMMVVGATVTGLLWFALSRATNFGEFMLINGLFGICVGAATTIPCSLIIAGWFERQRGLAMGIAFSGMWLGGAAMTMVANFAVGAGGWRIGYVALASPVVFLAVPAIVIFVRARKTALVESITAPAGALSAQAAAADPPPAIEVPGLEVAQAIRTRSMWLICIAQLLAGLSTGIAPQYIAYLTGLGYSATVAASVTSLFLIVTTAGTLLGGPFADRFTARGAMMATFALNALAMIGLLEALHPAALVFNVIAGGFAAGALAVQMPLVIIESLGLKRLGSMMGLTGVFFTAGAAVSPIITGRIFDVTGSYAIALIAFVAMLAVCAVAIFGCRPLDREQEGLAPSQPAAA